MSPEDIFDSLEDEVRDFMPDQNCGLAPIASANTSRPTLSCFTQQLPSYCNLLTSVNPNGAPQPQPLYPTRLPPLADYEWNIFQREVANYQIPNVQTSNLAIRRKVPIAPLDLTVSNDFSPLSPFDADNPFANNQTQRRNAIVPGEQAHPSPRTLQGIHTQPPLVTDDYVLGPDSSYPMYTLPQGLSLLATNILTDLITSLDQDQKAVLHNTTLTPALCNEIFVQLGTPDQRTALAFERASQFLSLPTRPKPKHKPPSIPTSPTDIAVATYRAQVSPTRDSNGGTSDTNFHPINSHSRTHLRKACYPCHRVNRKCNNKETTNGICDPCRKLEQTWGKHRFDASKMCTVDVLPEYLEFTEWRASMNSTAKNPWEGREKKRHERQKYKELKKLAKEFSDEYSP